MKQMHITQQVETVKKILCALKKVKKNEVIMMPIHRKK